MNAGQPAKPSPKFVAIGHRVMQGSNRIALATSGSMAQRIAHALNRYTHPRYTTAPKEEPADAGL